MEYFVIVTKRGLEKIAEAIKKGTSINITQFSIGDGGGKAVVPNENQTSLVSQKWMGDVISYIKKDNIISASTEVPADVGTFTVREMGIFDSDGDLFAVANVPDTVKDNGSGIKSVLNLTISVKVNNAETVKFDIISDYDKELSDTSVNAVQNCVIKKELDDKLSKSGGGIVKGETTFEKNVYVLSHILGKLCDTLPDIDFASSLGTLCFGLRYGRGTTDNWLSSIEFNRDGNINTNVGNSSHTLCNVGNYTITKDGNMLFTTGYRGIQSNPTGAAREILDVSEYNDGQLRDWEAFKNLIRGLSMHLLSGADIYMTSSSNLVFNAYGKINMFSNSFWRKTPNYEEEIGVSDSYAYRSFANGNKTVSALGNIEIIPGNTGEMETNSPDGKHYVRLSNIKGTGKGPDGQNKPIISNYSDIRSQQFTEDSIKLEDKYNKKFVNYYTCTTEANIATKEVYVDGLSEKGSNFKFLVNFVNGSMVNGITYININGKSYEIVDINDGLSIDNLLLDKKSVYIFEYEYDDANESDYVKLCGVIGELGSNTNLDLLDYPTYGLVTGAGENNGVIVANGRVYHNMSEGFKHIPAGGDKGQVLVNDGSGAKWSTRDEMPYFVCDTSIQNNTELTINTDKKLVDGDFFLMRFTNNELFGTDLRLTINSPFGNYNKLPIYKNGKIFEYTDADILYLVKINNLKFYIIQEFYLGMMDTRRDVYTYNSDTVNARTISLSPNKTITVNQGEIQKLDVELTEALKGKENEYIIKFIPAIDDIPITISDGTTDNIKWHNEPKILAGKAYTLCISIVGEYKEAVLSYAE